MTNPWDPITWMCAACHTSATIHLSPNIGPKARIIADHRYISPHCHAFAIHARLGPQPFLQSDLKAITQHAQSKLNKIKLCPNPST